MSEIYFDEIIKVCSIEDDKIRNKVSRVIGKSEDGKFHLELDVPTTLYSMLPEEKYRLLISNSLYLNGSDVPGNFNAEAHESLADEFEFVMHGLMFKISEPKECKTDVVVHISFGGFLLMLKGDLLKMHQFTNRKLFLLLRKI